MRLSTGREVDTSCPLMDQCWADQGCMQPCPETVVDALQKAGIAEHEIGWVPHTDPDIAAVCPNCKGPDQ